MANSVINLKNVTKFDGQTFQLWKFQIRAIFIAYNLLDIVNGTAVKLEAAGQQQTAWIQRNAKATVLMSAAMHPTQLEHLTTCDSTAEM